MFYFILLKGKDLKRFKKRLICNIANKMISQVNMNNLEKEITDDLGKYIETPWTIIESYFKDQHLSQLVRHQLESYNNFVNYQIQKTIDMFNPVQICSENDYDKKSGKHSLEIFITDRGLLY